VIDARGGALHISQTIGSVQQSIFRPCHDSQFRNIALTTLVCVCACVCVRVCVYTDQIQAFLALSDTVSPSAGALVCVGVCVCPHSCLHAC